MSARAVTSAIGRIGAFAISAGATSLVGLVVLPLLNIALGNDEWGRLVLVQTVGALGGVAVAYGWGATGAAMVAGTPVSQRQAFYRDSLRIRGLLYLAAVPLAGVLLLLLFRGDPLTSFLGAAVYLLPHLGAIWYFTGEGRPLRLFLCDTLPTIAGTILGVVLAFAGGEIWMFLLGQGAGYVVAVALDAFVVLRGAPRVEFVRSRLTTVLRDQRHAVIATGTSAVYVSLPVIAVQIFLPQHLGLYAMADRLFRYASLALLPIQQYFQSWVPATDGDLRHRARIAGLASVGIGAVAGAAIALLSPWASPLLSGGQVHVPLSLSVPLGVAFVGIGTAAIVGYACLVAFGRVGALAASTVIGAVVGIPLIAAFAMLGSLPLVAWAVAASELCVAGYQVTVLRRALRRTDQID